MTAPTPPPADNDILNSGVRRPEAFDYPPQRPRIIALTLPPASMRKVFDFEGDDAAPTPPPADSSDARVEKLAVVTRSDGEPDDHDRFVAKCAISDMEAAGLLVVLPDDELWAQMERVLVAHQRHGLRECLCGWSVLGISHPGHQVDMLLAALAERPSGGAG